MRGKRAEIRLEVQARRTAQYCGKTGEAADIVGLPGISIECKRVENLNINNAMAQATHDAEAAGRGDLPVVFHRKSYCPWLVTMQASDFFTIYREWEAARNGQSKADGVSN